jgi:hypothetical protein
MASQEELLGWRLALLTAAKAMVTATAIASLERSLLLLLRSHCSRKRQLLAGSDDGKGSGDGQSGGVDSRHHQQQQGLINSLFNTGLNMIELCPLQ